MKQALLVFMIGLVLWGCSVNDSKENEELNSSSSDMVIKFSSSSVEPVVTGPTRSLNVIVDYLHYSAWVDNCKNSEQYWSAHPNLDTVVLDKQVGDSLYFHYSRLNPYWLGPNPVYDSFHCLISKGSCDGGPEIFMIRVQVQSALGGGLPWSLAQSDSAVIWDTAWGQPLDSNFTWIGPGYSAKDTWLFNGLIHGGLQGWDCSLQPISNSNISFFNPETLTIPDTLDIVVDYKNHKKWTDYCFPRLDNGIPETLSLVKTSEDSLWFERRGGLVTRGSKDTVICDLVQRYCIEGNGEVLYQTSLLIHVPFNNPQKSSVLDSLGKSGSLLIWQDSWADSLEAFTGQGAWYTSFIGDSKFRVVFDDLSYYNRATGQICMLQELE